MPQIDLLKYQEFVDLITSEESKDLEAFITRLHELATIVNVPRMITGGSGLSSEGGEFNEIIKKVLFQGKPLNDDTIFHMKRELGDIIWYWVQACIALNLDPNDVIAENVEKLKSRYPAGFDVYFSENRKDGDL